MRFNLASIFCGSLLCLINMEMQTAQALVDEQKQKSIENEINQNNSQQIFNRGSQWLSQQNSQNAIVTGVKLNSTETGLEIILETPSGEILQPLIYPQENTLIIDILDASLKLSSGQEFQAQNPSPEITQITVTQADANSIRITITGKTGVPTAEVKPSQSNLILSLSGQTAPTTPEAQEEIDVIATTDNTEDDYYVPNSTTATKFEIDNLDYPGSIQVIPREVIEDRQVIRLSELADNVSGVQAQSGYGGLSSLQTYIRGFPAGENFRNGFRDFSFSTPRDVANIERVEFLKGPASIVYGNLEPGGIINTTTKQPLRQSLYNFDGTFASFGLERQALDITGPLTQDDTLLYRLNVANENGESFRDFTFNDSIFVAPVLTWNISKQTSLALELNYQNYYYFFDRNFPPGDVFLDLPIDRVILGEPDFNRASFDNYYFSYNFEHKFSDDWKIRQGYSLNTVIGNTRQLQPASFGQFLEDDGSTLNRRAQKTEENQENYSLQTEVIGKFKTWSIKHQALVGVEYTNYKYAYTFYRSPYSSIDIFAPSYEDAPLDFTFSFAEKYGADNVGLYFQDLIELLPNLKILAGVRLDWADVEYRDRFSDEIINENSDFETSPRVGIVYQPGKYTSLYFSWSRSFDPEVFGINRTGEPFEPETATQYEVGLKHEFFQGRLAATLALYEITKYNVLTSDPDDPEFSIATGEQTSNGVEIELVGKILEGWNIIATYSYTNAYVSKDNSIPVGDNLVGIPLNSASLWTTYQIQKGNLQGLGFGLGIYYVDEREGELPNTDFQLPSYVRAEAAVFYRRGNYRIALNFKNLFNTEYYETQGFWVAPQSPFAVSGEFSIKF